MLATLHNDHPVTDWALASTLTAGALAWHMDLYQLNQGIASVGGLLGVAYMAVRLYFFLKEKMGDGGPKVDSGS